MLGTNPFSVIEVLYAQKFLQYVNFVIKPVVKQCSCMDQQSRSAIREHLDYLPCSQYSCRYTSEMTDDVTLSTAVPYGKHFPIL